MFLDLLSTLYIPSLGTIDAYLMGTRGAWFLIVKEPQTPKHMRVPKTVVPFRGPHDMDIIYWGLYWGPLIMETSIWHFQNGGVPVTCPTKEPSRGCCLLASGPEGSRLFSLRDSRVEDL